ncbi:outer membrane receptor for ferrienterochelin and colicins [Methylomarinovum caldicuralii]|uniref:Outer membrane receptor for ferrienterochelin and colicins n=1 Tax=Methylomarinovum caldicuralii TaxID=438856 RepID=A0AAU9CXT6_9GAMM|nr:TonB-dependent receptor [Methylomarinovum caldicuralii]BCX82807.1 outer membrane receptor for ferrienterochelin and colicins [Methylomarinovum caldicuralii]
MRRLLAALLFLPPPLLAAPPAEDEYETLFADIPSVLTAARHLQPANEALGAVDVIDAGQLRRFGYRTLAEALASLPGFQMVFNRSYQRLASRGFFTPGDYNTHILLLIDGHRVNESLQDYAGLGSDFLLDLNDIDHIEVVRDPGSALYGSSAYFAVINVITRSAAEAPAARLEGRAASLGRYGGYVSAAVQAPERALSAYFSASRWSEDGRRVLDFPGLPKIREADGADGRRLFAKLAWRGWTLSGAYMQRDEEHPDYTLRPPVVSDYKDRRAYADLRGEHDLGGWHTTLRLFWDRYEFNGRYPFSPTNRDLWHGEWAGAEALAQRDLGSDHHLLLGGEFRGNYRQQMDNFDQNPKTVWARNRLRSSFFGFFAQDEWRLGPDLTLQLGLRVDHYSHTDDTPLSPRAGLIYRPRPETALKLLYGRAYRAPSRFEASYTCCQGIWLPNPNLRPEHIHTLEGIWEQQWGQGLSSRLAGYFYRAEDLLQQQEISGSVVQYRNGGTAVATGFDASLGYRRAGFDAMVGYSFQNLEDVHGRRWPHSARHLLKSRLAVPLWREKLSGALEIDYTGPRPVGDGRSTGDVVLMNLTLSSQDLLPGLDLDFALYNLLDDHYRDPPAAPVIPAEIPQNGRTFRVRVGYRF